MHRLTFRMEHHGCWATDVSAAFPDAAFVVRASVPLQGRALDVTRVYGFAPGEFRHIAAFVARHEGVRASTILEDGGNVGFFLVESKPGRSLIDAITMHQGFLLAPTQVEQGVETWAVGLADQAQAAPLLESIGTLGVLHSHRLARESFPDVRLSDAQRRVLRAAMAEGYYDFPRRISPTLLAKRLGLAKSTLLEHLRKAEAKVMLAQEGLI